MDQLGMSNKQANPLPPQEPAGGSGSAAVAPAGRTGVRALLGNQGITMFLILILMWLVLAFLSPYFFTVRK